MKCNAEGAALIKSFESCRLSTYLDSVGVPTIGWGHTAKDVKLGQTISQHQADVIFDSDLERFEEGVSELTRMLTLTSNQFSALVSFAFNLGVTRLASSTLYKRLMAKDFPGAAAQFDKWTLAGGHVLNGLIKRRAAERALFEKADA